MNILKEFVPIRVIIEDPKIVKLVNDLTGVMVVKKFVHVIVDVGVNGVAADVGVAPADGDRVAAAADVATVDGDREAIASDVASADGDKAVIAGVVARGGAAEVVFGGTTVVDERVWFSPFGGRDFSSPFTIGGAVIGSPTTVATSTHKQTTCTCGCQACVIIIHGLVSKMYSLEETVTRVDTREDSIGENGNTLISKRGIILSSRVIRHILLMFNKKGEDKSQK